MTLEALDNLVKIRRLNKEPPDQNQEELIDITKELVVLVEALGSVR